MARFDYKLVLNSCERCQSALARNIRNQGGFQSHQFNKIERRICRRAQIKAYDEQNIFE
jgi:hypothetical protein